MTERLMKIIECQWVHIDMYNNEIKIYWSIWDMRFIYK